MDDEGSRDLLIVRSVEFFALLKTTMTGAFSATHQGSTNEGRGQNSRLSRYVQLSTCAGRIPELCKFP